MRFSRALLRAGIVGATLLAAYASAAPVTVTFGGTIDVVQDPTGEVVLAPGTPFTATVVYDDGSSAPPEPVINGMASYNWMPSPPSSITFEAGSWRIGTGPFDPDERFPGPGYSIEVLDRSGGPATPDAVSWRRVVEEVEGLDVPFLAGGPGFGFCCSFLSLGLEGTEEPLASTRLDEIPLDLTEWVAAELSIDLYLDPDAETEIFVGGTITSLTVVPSRRPSRCSGPRCSPWL